MSENERLAKELVFELERARIEYILNRLTDEQYLMRVRIIYRASNL